MCRSLGLSLLSCPSTSTFAILCNNNCCAGDKVNWKPFSVLKTSDSQTSCCHAADCSCSYVLHLSQWDREQVCSNG